MRSWGGGLGVHKQGSSSRAECVDSMPEHGLIRVLFVVERFCVHVGQQAWAVKKQRLLARQRCSGWRGWGWMHWWRHGHCVCVEVVDNELRGGHFWWRWLLLAFPLNRKSIDDGGWVVTGASCWCCRDKPVEQSSRFARCWLCMTPWLESTHSQMTWMDWMKRQ